MGNSGREEVTEATGAKPGRASQPTHVIECEPTHFKFPSIQISIFFQFDSCSNCVSFAFFPKISTFIDLPLPLLSSYHIPFCLCTNSTFEFHLVLARVNGSVHSLFLIRLETYEKNSHRSENKICDSLFVVFMLSQCVPSFSTLEKDNKT